jgi:hypothetical protein
MGPLFRWSFCQRSNLDEMDMFANKFTDATDIIILGASAGDIGTWTHLDYITERYPQARVSGLTVAGH